MPGAVAAFACSGVQQVGCGAVHDNRPFPLFCVDVLRAVVVWPLFCCHIVQPLLLNTSQEVHHISAIFYQRCTEKKEKKEGKGKGNPEVYTDQVKYPKSSAILQEFCDPARMSVFEVA